MDASGLEWLRLLLYSVVPFAVGPKYGNKFVLVDNSELHENMELVCSLSLPPFCSWRRSFVGRRRLRRLQIASGPPSGEPRSSPPARRPASFGEEAETDCARSAPLGVAVRSLERLAFRTDYGPAGNRHWLAPEGLSAFLEVENPSRPAWSPKRSKRRPPTDPHHEPGKPAVGRASHSW